MESKQVTILKEITYWNCNVPEHRHKNKDIADRCIQKHIGPRSRLPRIERKLRWCEVTKEVLHGMSYKDAGDIMGVSRTQARYMCAITLRGSMHPKYRIPELSGEHFHPISIPRKKPELWSRQIDNFIARLVKLWEEMKNDSKIEA